MYISTELEGVIHYGSYEEILSMLKEVGFDAYDFSMTVPEIRRDFVDNIDGLEKAKKLREYADKIGIVCNQSHAPFPVAEKDNPQIAIDMLEVTKRSIEVSAILGAKIVVIHPSIRFTAEENAEMYKAFEETAKKCNIKIGLENLVMYDAVNICHCPAACGTVESYKKHLSLLNNDIFVACVDIGHAEVLKDAVNAPELIRVLGDKVRALHIHDNEKLWDIHELPYTGKIDFAEVLQALKDIRYQGDITFESIFFPKKMPKELCKSAMRMMYDIGAYFRQQINNYE